MLLLISRGDLSPCEQAKNSNNLWLHFSHNSYRGHNIYCFSLSNIWLFYEAYIGPLKKDLQQPRHDPQPQPQPAAAVQPQPSPPTNTTHLPCLTSTLHLTSLQFPSPSLLPSPSPSPFPSPPSPLPLPPLEPPTRAMRGEATGGEYK